MYDSVKNSINELQNLVKFDHSVLKAFSPYFAGEYFVRNKTEGWKSLGGILLCFTGTSSIISSSFANKI
jgi:KUP system potassium uptake protein